MPQMLLLLALLLAPPLDEFRATYRAVCLVESGGRADAYNENEWAAGIAQIRPCYVADVNRIAGIVGDPRRWTLEDRWDVEKSYELYTIYTVYWGCRSCRITGKVPGPEQFARIHNGGPNGWWKASTLDYWRRAQRRMP